MKYEIANPHPAGTIESLRSLGYSVEAAVADLVDNSIAAKAQQVDVVFTWDGRDSWVAVTDDGHGMTETELVTAMTIAARGPGTPRTPRDLGRFGMGLKTASFSQARQLIVTSAPSEHAAGHPGLGPGPGQENRAVEAAAGHGHRRPLLLDSLWPGRGTIVLVEAPAPVRRPRRDRRRRDDAEALLRRDPPGRDAPGHGLRPLPRQPAWAQAERQRQPGAALGPVPAAPPASSSGFPSRKSRSAATACE